MKLPELNNPAKYIGLYIIDFGDNCALGYTAAEVAAIVESEKFADVKIYKIHQARPDGSLELKGVPIEKFALESVMIFHCPDGELANEGFEKLYQFSQKQNVPCLARLQIAKVADDDLLMLIYPAEYEEEVGHWLSDSGFVGYGAIDAGVSQLESFYQMQSEIVRTEQLVSADQQCRDFATLLAAVGDSLQRKFD